MSKMFQNTIRKPNMLNYSIICFFNVAIFCSFLHVSIELTGDFTCVICPCVRGSLLHSEVLFKHCRLDTSTLQSYECELVVYTQVSCFL